MDITSLLNKIKNLGKEAEFLLKELNNDTDSLLIQDDSLINHVTSKAIKVYPDEERSWTQSPFPAMLMSAEAHCIYRLVKMLGEGNYADLGVMNGGSTAIMGYALEYIKKPGRIFSVDLFGRLIDGKPVGSFEVIEKLENYFAKNFQFAKLQICQGTTDEWAEKLHEKFNLIFIDADHSYEAVKSDFYNWSPKVKEGGYLLFHDTHFRSVNKFLKELNNEDWQLIEHIFRLKVYKKL